jgi:quercetin dioxygenase-like cupin family protein
MRHFLSIASAFALALFVSGQAVAHQPPAQPPITRTVVAATKLPTVTDRPLLFRALSVTIPPGEKSSVSTADGILYQMSGSTEVSIGGEAKTLSPGEGMFLAGGKLASLKAGTGEGSTFLHFLLVPAPDQDQSVETGAALYYVISGRGANTVDGKTDAKEPGSLIYEPFGLVHQWGNPGDAPFTFLAFNINPEGVAAVIPGAPTR